MKKVMLVVLAVLVSMVFVAGVFAQSEADAGKAAFNNKLALAKTMTFEGTVLSHDVQCHCIVLKGAKMNLTVQDDYASFMQEYNKAKGLAIGAKVKVTYKTVDYINYATKIE